MHFIGVSLFLLVLCSQEYWSIHSTSVLSFSALATAFFDCLMLASHILLLAEFQFSYTNATTVVKCLITRFLCIGALFLTTLYLWSWGAYNCGLQQGIQKVLDVRFHPGGDPLLVVSCNEVCFLQRKYLFFGPL